MDHNDDRGSIMRKTRTITFAGAAAAALLIGGLTATPAQATSEETGFSCTYAPYEEQHFIIRGTWPTFPGGGGQDFQRCWVSSGDLDIDQVGVTYISAGPYSGYINYKPGDGQTHSQTFSAHQHITKDFGEVVHIHID